MVLLLIQALSRENRSMSAVTQSAFTSFELEHLCLWGARIDVDVVVVSEGPHSGGQSAYIGTCNSAASWALDRSAARLWLHRIDGLLWSCQVQSVDDAIYHMGAELGWLGEKLAFLCRNRPPAKPDCSVSRAA